ncbi:MAG: InlB B-repeat-containing protein [Anaerovoracaceae bacterium]
MTNTVIVMQTANTTTGNSSTAKVEINIPAPTKYTVKIIPNAGTGAPSQQAKNTDRRDLNHFSLKLKRTGWRFLGWAESAYAVKASRQPSSVYKSNASISLYAVWKKTLTPKTSSGQGTGATGLPQPQSADIYNSTSSYIFTIPSEAPSRDLYEFLGWSTD